MLDTDEALAPKCRKCRKPMLGHRRNECHGVDADVKPSLSAPIKRERKPLVADAPCAGEIISAPGPSNPPPPSLISIPPDGRRVNPHARLYLPDPSIAPSQQGSWVPTELIGDPTKPSSSHNHHHHHHSRSPQLLLPSATSDAGLDAETHRQVNAKREVQKRFGLDSLSVTTFHDFQLAQTVAAEYVRNDVQCFVHHQAFAKGKEGEGERGMYEAEFWVIVYTNPTDLCRFLERNRPKPDQSPPPVVEMLDVVAPPRTSKLLVLFELVKVPGMVLCTMAVVHIFQKVVMV